MSLQCLLMNRTRCACSCKAGYKGSVGLVGPSATGSDWGHGYPSGFTPLLLNKHTKRSDWSGGLSNHGAADPLRTTAAGSASTRSFIGSSARLFYMNQRANYAFLPMFPLLGFVIRHKDVTKHEAVDKSAALFTTLLSVFREFSLCLHLWITLITRLNEKRIKESVQKSLSVISILTLNHLIICFKFQLPKSFKITFHSVLRSIFSFCMDQYKRFIKPGRFPLAYLGSYNFL